MKNRFLSTILALMVVLCLLPAAGSKVYAAAAEETAKWLQFSEDNQTIVGFDYQAGLSPNEIVIPASHNGTRITAIGANAFYG